ncbi:putative ankyrin repeat-containing domain-containing protein [Rosa chinensis]|uniref:Putative ankyrin repeat-containing domain-containing protein n=1 Tax=Rosa chinensis TaxID=74649 RepID=A0A2P6S4R6_ROSCH|nr:putative ankyrin repeat-containing domain-containing protein [Rosa chinensis]
MRIVLLLLKHGALVSQRNNLGLTEFHIAASNGNSEALEVLLLEDPDGVHISDETECMHLNIVLNVRTQTYLELQPLLKITD